MFIPESGHGLTKAGLGRINRSIEAFVYCVLGAQVNTRTSIVSKGGGGFETQQNFIKLFESSVIEMMWPNQFKDIKLRFKNQNPDLI